MYDRPKLALWEFTMGCNMRCKHCGSTCQDRLSDELTNKESLELCDRLKKLGVEYVTLSGGEPTIRQDCFQIAKRLIANNIQTNIISNGWLVNENMIKIAKEIGLNNFGLSLDGLERTHDYMRRKGSYNRVMQILDLLKRYDLPASIITAINKQNITELDALRQILVKKRVASWQLQFALPMGTFHSYRDDLLIEPSEINDIINFAYDHKDGDLVIVLSDCIGYYSDKETELKSIYVPKDQSLDWQGCSAGITSFSISHNGNVKGCNSLREDAFIEGNIRNDSLEDIWQTGFKWRRELFQDKLEGVCQKCVYGDLCLGGCSAVKLYIQGKYTSENKYCIYNLAVQKALKSAPKTFDENFIQSLITDESYQAIVVYLSDLLESNENTNRLEQINRYLAFSYYKLGNVKNL